MHGRPAPPRHRPAPRPACVAAPVGAGVLQALGAWQRSERPPWLLEPRQLLACAVATCLGLPADDGDLTPILVCYRRGMTTMQLTYCDSSTYARYSDIH